MKKEQLILGVDPGTTVLGWSILKVNGKHSELVAVDILKLNKLPDQAAKLKAIFEFIFETINQYQPTVLSIEAPFFGKNAQSMIKLGRAQGVIIGACLHRNMEVHEYSPRKIKQSITGNGNASKEQVAAMLKNIYPDLEIAKYLDATDALAAAVCHHLQNKFGIDEPKLSGWGSFISKNSDRIIK